MIIHPATLEKVREIWCEASLREQKTCQSNPAKPETIQNIYIHFD
jgi:hypothetical protein